MESLTQVELDNNNKSKVVPISKEIEHSKSRSIFKQWTIVFACCWINIAVFAMLKSSGVLYLAILQNFEGSTSADASWQITLINSISAITSLPAGFLTHYHTERSIVFVGIIITSTAISTCYFASSIFMINVLLGFVQGMGLGLVFGQLPAIITQYFDAESRAAAVGVSYAGSTIGSIFSPILFDMLLQSFPLQESCLIMGLISLTSILGATLLIPHPVARAEKEAKKSETFSTLVAQIKEDINLVKDPHFALICISYSTHYLSSITVMMLLTDFAIHCGLSHRDSVLLLSFISVGNLLGRLSPLMTKLFGCHKFNDKITFVTSMICLPLIYISFPILASIQSPFIPLIIQFMVLVVLIGFFASFQLVLAPVLLAEYLGSNKTAVSFGLINFVSGLVSFSRPVIITVVGSNKDNYPAIFYTFSIFPLVSAVLWAIFYFFKLKCK